MNKLNTIKRGLFVFIMLMTLCGCSGKKGDASSDSSENAASTTTTAVTTMTTTKPETTTTKAKTTTTKPKVTTTAKQTTTTAVKTSPPTEPTTAKPENTYNNNEYYDVVERSCFINSSGNSFIVDKVLAKKNISVSSSCVALASDGSVVGKCDDTIILTVGQYNYFCYSFEGVLSSETYKFNAHFEEDSPMIGERNAVEAIQVDRSGDELFITFKQTGNELSTFAKFKLLFYKNNEIVGTDEGFFSMSAPNLNGSGSTDVAQIWTYDTDYDSVECYFEP